MASTGEAVLLAPAGVGVLPVCVAGPGAMGTAFDEARLSRQLAWELRAWAERPRGTPHDELVFRVQAHRLAADLRVELGLGTRVFCLEIEGEIRPSVRTRDEILDDAEWLSIPVARRLERFPRLGLSRDAFVAPSTLPFVPPDDNGDVGQRVRIVEEWGCDFPVWGIDSLWTGWVGLLEAEDLSIGSDLTARFVAWNREWESWSQSVVDDRHDSEVGYTGRVVDPFVSYEARLEHIVEGHRLAAELQAACGPALAVVYP